MPRVKVMAAAELTPGKGALVTVNGQDIALFRRGDEVLAIGNDCPHQGASLWEGWVEGDIVICPVHGWEFDMRSGACMTVPGESVPRYPVTVEDGAIYVSDEAAEAEEPA
jgi:nitrite reductase/ring-hydroxylating ferredoxin subunit